ncbi:MAG: serine hydrolase domain-containing protein [Gaiellaceae bacterium]
MSARIASYLAEETAKKRFSGTALVAVGGKVVLQRSYGMADRTRRVANTPSTRYRINWYIRRWLAVALLQLEERRRVSLDAPACRFVDGCRRLGRSFTLADVLDYRATLEVPPLRSPTDLRGWAMWARTRGLLVAAAEPEFVIDDDLLLAAAVERSAAMPWLRYLRLNVFRRAKMHATAIASGRLRARGYIGRPDGTFRRALAPKRFVQPDIYGLATTAHDLWLFDRALWEAKIVQRKTLNRLLLRPFGWKYGWLIGRENGLLAASGTAHGDPGWYALAVRYPTKRLSIILLANEGPATTLTAPGAALGDLESGISSIALKRPCHTPPRSAAVDPGILAAYAGSYDGKRIYGTDAINPPPPELDLTASVVARRLVVQWDPRQNARFGNFFSSGPLIPLSSMKFASERDPDLRFAFSRDGDALKLLVTHVCFPGVIVRLLRVSHSS